jgi:peptide/nickel transport system substrate-binding protein
MHRRSFLQSAASVAAISASPLFGRRAQAQGKNVLRMGFADEVLTLDPIKTVYGPDILIQGIM